MNLTTQQVLEVFNLSKTSAFNWRQRRHDEWRETYSLYRDKVVLNRLIQRQSVNVPLMKYTVKTLLKDIDDLPVLYFDNLDNDEQKEVFYNEYWNYIAKENKLTVKDIVDKKQVLLYGRSFKKLNIVNGKFYFEIVDPQDILVDRYVDPANLDSARCVIHTHIFKPLSSLDENEFYDKEAIARLKIFYATQQGLIKVTSNAQDFIEKNQRMSDLGVPDVDNPVLGETYVELNEGYLVLKDNDGKDKFFLLVIADDLEVLMIKSLSEVIGKTTDDFWDIHIPLTSWGDDPERTDFWSDGIGDTVRTSNKILNSWISQLVENRTLRNFGMHYYNSSVENFVPQTFTPVAWGWYPVPGNPRDVLQKVDIPELSESLDEITFIMQLAEKASAATAASQGQMEQRKVTLGEVQLAITNAKERVRSMAPLYTESWKEFGLKYVKMLEAAGDMLDEVKIFKKGRSGKRIYSRVITPADWETTSGYGVDVKEVSQNQQENLDTLEKLNAVRSIMVNNKPLDGIYKRKLCELAGLNAVEVKDVLDFEKQQPAIPQVLPGAEGQPTGTSPPVQPPAMV